MSSVYSTGKALGGKQRKSMANQRRMGQLFIRERIDLRDINRKEGMK